VDPLNLVGILTPGPRVPAVRRNTVVYHDGAPVAAGANGTIVRSTLGAATR
jgi:ATP-dependent Lhr-like helicase